MSIKCFIERTSSLNWHDVRNYNNLEDCVNDLLDHENYGNGSPELVISKPRKYMVEEAQSCDYCVEIYDTWRE